ncbi:MAG: HAMP domain-containing histidine kinase [Candidatus Eremiobacteraeota bacterium]|nr:HAMP domain-containing histidine kinase [Candidatus Eremiobacteraeota bacterium]
MTPVGEERELSFWRRSRRLDRLVARYIIVLTAVLAIVVATFTWLDELDRELRSTDSQRYDAQRLMHAQTDEQTGLSALAAAGKASSLQPYLTARHELDVTLASLRHRTRRQPQIAQALDAFAVAHENWERSVAGPILRTRSESNDVPQRAGASLIETMRNAIASIDRYYEQRVERIVTQRSLLRFGSYSLILLAIVVVATFGYYSERASAHREERLLRSVLEQRDTVARQSEWRKKIIAILAHDFRTSLAVIQANAELVETHPDTQLRKNAFRAIYKGVSDLSSMTDEALLMARVANDTLVITPERVFIYDVIAEAADRFSNRQDIRVTLSDDFVWGDGRYLSRVFDNLISNAVKYSNGPIDVRIASREKTVEVSVVDRGPGIDATDLPHVFEEYWRAESSRDKRGSGIGLYIVKKIVDAHHGAVSVESSPEGTTVRVVLARAQPPQPDED